MQAEHAGYEKEVSGKHGGHRCRETKEGADEPPPPRDVTKLPGLCTIYKIPSHLQSIRPRLPPPFTRTHTQISTMAKPLLVYLAPTPNGHKVSTVLEELKAAYGTNVVDYDYEEIVLSTNRQKEPWFIALNPNGRIPVLIDRSHKPAPFTVFESGAILLYLVRKYDLEGRFTFPAGSDEESELLQWIFFAHGGIGPMQGQARHFRQVAPVDIPYGKQRYTEETARLYGVLNIRLEGRDYLVGPGRGKLTIADLNAFPWVRLHEGAGIDLDAFPNVKAWVDRIAERPAVKAGLAIPQ